MHYPPAVDAGAGYVFRALAGDAVVQRLNMSQNDLRRGAESIPQIQDSLKLNKKLSYLNMSECRLSSSHAVPIAAGLEENQSLRTLVLANNLLEDAGAAALGRALVLNKGLRELDISGDEVGKTGCEAVAEGLMKNVTLEAINLSDNKLYDASAQALVVAVSQNAQIKRVKLGMNPMDVKYVASIEGYLRKNLARTKKEEQGEIVSEFTALSKAASKTVDLRSETEKVTKEKRRLKREVNADLRTLNEAMAHEDEGLAGLRKELEALTRRETQIDSEMADTDMQISV